MSCEKDTLTRLKEQYDRVMDKLDMIEVDDDKYGALMSKSITLSEQIHRIEEDLESHKNREEDVKRDKIDKVVRYAMDGTKIVASIAVPLTIYVASTLFEKDGYIMTTEAGKSSLRQLLKVNI